MSVKVISFINMKGGVAKTTTAVGVATMMAGKFLKRVLLVDLDPQTNATAMLIGEERWTELSDSKRTLYELFDNALNGNENFNVEDLIQKNVSKIKDVKTLDLLPSNTKLADMDYRILMSAKTNMTFFENAPVNIMERALKPIMDRYDYIILDCPPNIGLITLNGARISDAYVIPTIPDILSTHGLNTVIKRMENFSEKTGKKIQLLGIVFTKARKQSTLHMRIMKEMPYKYPDIPVFSNVFYESNTVANAAEFYSVSSLKKKWGYKDHYDSLVKFTDELMRKAEID